ncbi:hypothetical protein [Stutzerimonas azotifigens]|uniref:hypothetical protein n=1 Tax=Stutzerimonas azotifigens TaxID=291995 RepID=UPI0003FCDD53|nr:hypothetical protein [Stutzerimonas azotifigens]
MTNRLCCAFGLGLLLLAGCEREVPAPPGPAPTPAAPTTEPSAPARPEPPAVPPPSQAQAAAVAASSAPAAPPRERRPASPAKGQAQAEENVRVQSLDLDLSLPEDWAAELMPESMEPQPLLPPLFGAHEPDGVGLSGRLISGQQPDDPLIQGAEVQFEFRR